MSFTGIYISILHFQSVEQSDDPCKELKYTVDRLIKGLASSRKWARLGFATALAQVWLIFILVYNTACAEVHMLSMSAYFHVCNLANHLAPLICFELYVFILHPNRNYSSYIV